MGISIILPIYKDRARAERLLSLMAEQRSDDFELIIALDTNQGNNLKIIDNVYNYIGNKVKLIYNTKRQNHMVSIENAISLATHEYSIIISSGTNVDSYFVEKIKIILNTKKADIIEFPLTFSGLLKGTIHPRKNVKMPLNISEGKILFSYILPFEFNKLIKTDVLRKVFSKKNKLYLSSSFSPVLSYQCLIHAKTYQTTSKTLLSTNILKNDLKNPFILTRDFERFLKTVDPSKYKEYEQEFRYAQFYLMVVFISAIIHEKKNKNLNIVYKKAIQDGEKTVFNSFFETNKYLLANSFETESIKSHYSNFKMHRLYKIFNSKNAK